jgi:hypothetical protein
VIFVCTLGYYINSILLFDLTGLGITLFYLSLTSLTFMQSYKRGRFDILAPVTPVIKRSVFNNYPIEIR